MLNADLHQTELPRGRESGVFLIARESEIDPDSDDVALIEAMIQNDTAAWREFQRRYDRLIRHCIGNVTRRFMGATREDQREIYAIFVLSLIANDRKKLRAFDPALGYRFSSWMGRLAINCAHDYLRVLAREPKKEPLAEAVELQCEMPDPFDQAVEHERAEIASRTLEGFSKTDRRFAALYFGEGLPPAEVARSLNISLNTVYSKRNKIQSRLAAEHFSAAK